MPEAHRPDDQPREPEDGDQPPPLRPVVPAFQLNANEELVAAELRRIDPQLEGLYRSGHEFCARGSAPGTTYIVAIAGRELSRGVIRKLAEQAPELSDAEKATISPDEGDRRDIARALRLHPHDPTVGHWRELIRRFSGEGKYVEDRQTPSSAVADFLTLSSLLIGRLTPYFRAQDATDALLAVQEPTEAHADAVRQVIVRPPLRAYFFRALQSPAWLELLTRLRVFERPPGRFVHPDGAWSVVTWLEGEYLARVARSRSKEVAALLLTIPADNDNPAVWDAAARAAIDMAPEIAAPIVRHALNGLKAMPFVVAPETMVSLGRHVALADASASLELASALLAIRSRDDVLAGNDANEEVVQRLKYSTGWLLRRIEQYSVQAVLSKLIPTVAEADPLGTLKLLAKKLHAAMRGMDPDWKEETPRATTYWCRDLEPDGDDDMGDLRAMLLRRMAQTALSIVNKDPSVAGIGEWISNLQAAVGQRVQYYLIARTALFHDQLNVLLRRKDVLVWEMPGREVGDVLRARFSDASQDAQQVFLSTLEAGPGEDAIARSIEWAREFDEADQSREGALARWQRKQLARFGRNLPDVLGPLAQRIGYEPTDPNLEELDLTEVGWSHGGGIGSLVGDRSPIPSERLITAPAFAVAAEIRDWTPRPGRDESPRGLDDAMEQLTKTNPDRALELASALLGIECSRGLSGVLRGLRAIPEQQPLNWDAIALLLRGTLVGRPNGEREWRWVASAAVDLVEHVVPPRAPLAVVSEAFELGTGLLDHPTTWEQDDDDEDFTTIDAVISASINVLPGRLLHMLVALALRKNRDLRPTTDDEAESAVRSDVGAQLQEVVEGVLKRSGRRAIATRAAIGRFLPQLRWFSPAWWDANAADLLNVGIADPIRDPIWPAYLMRAGYYDATFRALRTFYVTAAKRGPRPVVQGTSRTWEVEPYLASHGMTALLRGEAAIGDADALVETTFTNALPEDASHTYWEVFRGWTDAEEKGKTIPPEFVDRLRSFWEWRLAQLEAMEDNKRRSDEAAGLLWFARTPFLAADDIIALGTRTLGLVAESGGTLHSLWERLGELAAIDADAVFVMLERAIRIELRSKFAHFPMSDLEPVFREVFANGSPATQEAALRLLDELGDNGFKDFGRFRPPRKS